MDATDRESSIDAERRTDAAHRRRRDRGAWRISSLAHHPSPGQTPLLVAVEPRALFAATAIDGSLASTAMDVQQRR